MFGWYLLPTSPLCSLFKTYCFLFKSIGANRSLRGSLDMPKMHEGILSRKVSPYFSLENLVPLVSSRTQSQRAQRRRLVENQ